MSTPSFTNRAFAVIVDGTIVATGRVVQDRTGTPVALNLLTGAKIVASMFEQAKARVSEAARDAAAIVVEGHAV